MTICVPAKFTCWNFNSQCEGIWKWELLEATRPWGIRTHGWNSILIKETPERAPREEVVRGQWSMNQEMGPYQISHLPVPWSWTPQSPELRKNTLLLFINHLVYGILLWEPKRTKTGQTCKTVVQRIHGICGSKWTE